MTTPPLEMIWPHYPAPEGHSCDAMGCASAGPHNIEPELIAMTKPINKRGCPTCNGVDPKSCLRCRGKTRLSDWNDKLPPPVKDDAMTTPTYTPEQLRGWANTYDRGEVEPGVRKPNKAEMYRAHATLLEDLAAARSQIEMLRTGDTCARHCEGTAYRIEARRLATDLAAAQAELASVKANCKIVYWPKDGSYPIEHTMAANKDCYEMILAQMERDRAAHPKEWL